MVDQVGYKFTITLTLMLCYYAAYMFLIEPSVFLVV